MSELPYWNPERHAWMAEALLPFLERLDPELRDAFDETEELRTRVALHDELTRWIREIEVRLTDLTDAAMLRRTSTIIVNGYAQDPDGEDLSSLLLACTRRASDLQVESDRDRYEHLIEFNTDEDEEGNEVGPVARAETFFLGEPSGVPLSGQRVSVTGRFAFGTRDALAEAIEARNGAFDEAPSESTTLFLVGTSAVLSDGRVYLSEKLRSAIALREAGLPLVIAHEAQVIEALLTKVSA